MPSFDIVSEVDSHELVNAVDQANREITNRFDFKGANALFELKDTTITLTAPSDFQVKQMLDILQTKMAKRQIDSRALDAGDIKTTLSQATQIITVKKGIEKEDAKQITKLVKDSKIKVQTSIQGDQIRVTGKNRDDLQEAITLLREAELKLPLQYINFRD